MKIHWTSFAHKSFEEELYFILEKWNTEEMVKFTKIVEDFLKVLIDDAYLGKPLEKKDARIFVLSKQTSLIYKVIEDEKRIDLIFFWNNKKDYKNFQKVVEDL